MLPSLAHRYRIEREIGAGGMATVYLAEDLRHHRKVAVKVLHQHIAAVLGAERFLHEIQTTANLQHPHILPLFDSGEANGRLFFVMPFVDGETLRDRISREHQLPVGEATRIAAEIASALDYAHRHGVIHRDIKPENILLHDGRALVADFGIALAITPDATRLTETGLSLGTPTYMSPEQALGERALDARTDIYALGAMLFEMLTGAPPFDGPSAQAIVAKVLTQPAVPPSRLARGIPAALDEIVLTALSKDPGDRFPSAAAFQKALQHGEAPARPHRRRWRPQLLIAATAGVIAVGAGYVLLHRTPIKPVRSIAVLPLTNMTRDTANDYLSTGISGDLIDNLSDLHALEVTDRSASFRYRAPNPDIGAVAKELNGVDAIVTGIYEQSHGSIVVSVHLTDARRSVQLWSAKFSHEITRDLYQFSADVSDSIVRRLRLQITSAPAVRQARGVRDSTAHDKVLRASYLVESRDPVKLQQAIGLYSEAIDRDPTYAAAWAGRANAIDLTIPFESGGAVPARDFPLAKADVQRAIALDSNLAEAHATLGFIHVMFDRDSSSAATEFKRALTLDSTQSATWLFRAWYLVTTNRLDSAIASLLRARALDPRSAVIAARLGSLYESAKRFSEAEQALLTMQKLDSTMVAIAQLPVVYASAGQCDKAQQIERRYSSMARTQLTRGWIVSAKVICGERDSAEAFVGELENLAHAGKFVDAFVAAEVYAYLHREDKVRDWLRKAVDGHSWELYMLRVYPAFRPYAAQRWFQDILRQLHLL